MTPERKLWIAIVAQAIQDLKTPANESHFNKTCFEISDPWFETICELAEVSYEKALAYMLERKRAYLIRKARL